MKQAFIFFLLRSYSHSNMASVWLVVVSIFLHGCATTPMDASSYNKLSEQSMKALRSGLTRKHPSAYMLLASKLYADYQKDDAVVFYYVGQIRYRAFLSANGHVDGDREKDLYLSLKEAFGKPINEYAGENLDEWLKLIDRAIAWHESNPNNVTPKAEHVDIYENIIRDFKKLKTYIVLNKESIRAQRSTNGLINR